MNIAFPTHKGINASINSNARVNDDLKSITCVVLLELQ